MSEFDIQALFLTNLRLHELAPNCKNVLNWCSEHECYLDECDSKVKANAATIAAVEGIIKQLKAHGRELEIQGLTKALQEAGY